MRKCSTRCCPFDSPVVTIGMSLLVAYGMSLSAGIGMSFLVAHGMSLVADCMLLLVSGCVLFLAYGLSFLVSGRMLLSGSEVAYGVLLFGVRSWFFLGAGFTVLTLDATAGWSDWRSGEGSSGFCRNSWSSLLAGGFSMIRSPRLR